MWQKLSLFQDFVMVAMAKAESPSPLPMEPNPSFVVAFTLTLVDGTPSNSLILWRISSLLGMTLGRSAMTVASMCLIVQPRSRNLVAVSLKNIEDGASFQRESVFG